jgi:hypothetical protein
MTDLTAAHVRAWMVVRDTLEARHGLDEGEMAEQVVAALLNHPEVLCALAGVPTADVATAVPPPAMTGALIDAQRELRVLRAERDAAVGLASLPRRVVTAIASVMDGGAAAPEGADVAAELERLRARDEAAQAVAQAAEKTCAVIERVLNADASEGAPIWEWTDKEAEAGVCEVLAVADQLSAALGVLDGDEPREAMCDREDCETFRRVHATWWDRLADVVDYPYPRPGSRSQIFEMARDQLAELRARDEAAKAVVQEAKKHPRTLESTLPALAAAVDALARTYEDSGTGR